jgi:hypothetical protein
MAASTKSSRLNSRFEVTAFSGKLSVRLLLNLRVCAVGDSACENSVEPPRKSGRAFVGNAVASQRMRELDQRRSVEGLHLRSIRPATTGLHWSASEVRYQRRMWFD